MTFFEKLLQEVLNENFECEGFSTYILNMLFLKKKFHIISNKIHRLFPIDHCDRKILTDIASIVQDEVKVDMNSFLNESFAANEDYALTILNKLFASNNDFLSMKKFLQQKITHKITKPSSLKLLYAEFHSLFPNKSEFEE